MLLLILIKAQNEKPDNKLSKYLLIYYLSLENVSVSHLQQKKLLPSINFSRHPTFQPVKSTHLSWQFLSEFDLALQSLPSSIVFLNS